MPEAPLVIAGQEVPAGKRMRVELEVSPRFTGADVRLPVEVVHGRQPGPRLFISAAIHGDEINGVEIIRRILRQPLLKRLQGALIAVPVVNVYGFVGLSRYLPDRRDLNRSFPGSSSGSLAARLAHTFVREVVEGATHGIDLHTGAVHRTNLPQIRACLDQPETAKLAHAFGVPVILDANVRDGSLRQAVLERGVPMLLYEAGEALRFDETAIRAGVLGVTAVMRELGMLPARKTSSKRAGAKKTAPAPFVARSSQWVRASGSGILRTRTRLGHRVEAGESMGIISNPLGTEDVPVLAQKPGIVIGMTRLPLVNEGDALFHVASFAKPQKVEDSLTSFAEELRDLDE